MKNRSDEERGPGWPDAKAHCKATVSEMVVLVLERDTVAVTWPPETERMYVELNVCRSSIWKHSEEGGLFSFIGVVGNH